MSTPPAQFIVYAFGPSALAGAAPVLCGYDRRLQDAGREHGLLTISPG
jgi:hypothetical protein